MAISIIIVVIIVSLYIFATVITLVTRAGYWHSIGLWLCKHLGWHSVKDGSGTCHICGKTNLLCDSQGNWF